MANFLLIAPPRTGLIDGVPHGLIDLANYIRVKAYGHKVNILDLGILPLENAHKILIRFIKNLDNLKGIGFSTTTATYQASLYLAKAVKNMNPQLRIVFGGPHATYQDEVILRNHFEVDFVIRGEGEKPLLSLMDQDDDNYFVGIPSASYRQGGRIVINDQVSILSEDELSEIPLDLTDCDSWCFGRDKRFSYVTTRGCPRKCHFCAAGGVPFRSKSIDRITDDIKYLASLDLLQIAIEDNDFLYSHQRAESVCTIFSKLKTQCKGLDWDCQTRLEILRNPIVLNGLVQSQCSRIYLGLENFDEHSLIFLGKTTNPNTYLDDFINKTLPIILSTGLKISLNLQVGLPIENNISRNINLERLRYIGNLARLHDRTIEICPMLHVLYPGTKEYIDYSNELLLPDDIFETFTIWECKHPKYREFLSKHFAHGNGGIPIGILEQDKLKFGEFSLDTTKIQKLVDFVVEMSNIKGLQVLNYSKYLVNDVPEGPLAFGKEERNEKIFI